jgi:hypothetical protein
MSRAKTSAISSTPKRGWFGRKENPYPGSEGATTVKASAGSPPKRAGSVSIGRIRSNSTIDPGQPCDSRSGIGAGPTPGSWMK